MPEQRIGPFRLVRRIDIGWWNERYVGRTDDDSEPVIVDLLLPHVADNEPVRRAFLHATHVALSLEHPNIVRVLGVSTADVPRPYSWSESLSGARLDRILSEAQSLSQKVAVDAALLVAHDVALALEYASAEGVLHDALSPQFIQVMHDGRVVLVGFETGQLGAVAALIGEQPTRDDYVSPEQAEGKPRDVRSDLFRLGVVLYALLTGAPPFRRKGDVQFRKSLLHESVMSPSLARPEVPGEVDRLVLKLVQKSPAGRFASPTELREAISALLTPERIQVARAELADRASRLDELKPVH